MSCVMYDTVVGKARFTNCGNSSKQASKQLYFSQNIYTQSKQQMNIIIKGQAARKTTNPSSWPPVIINNQENMNKEKQKRNKNKMK